MKAQQNHQSVQPSIVVQRVIPASVVRRFRSDLARQKKGQKTLRRMKKERRDE